MSYSKATLSLGYYNCDKYDSIIYTYRDKNIITHLYTLSYIYVYKYIVLTVVIVVTLAITGLTLGQNQLQPVTGFLYATSVVLVSY